MRRVLFNTLIVAGLAVYTSSFAISLQGSGATSQFSSGHLTFCPTAHPASTNDVTWRYYEPDGTRGMAGPVTFNADSFYSTSSTVIGSHPFTSGNNYFWEIHNGSHTCYINIPGMDKGHAGESGERRYNLQFTACLSDDGTLYASSEENPDRDAMNPMNGSMSLTMGSKTYTAYSTCATNPPSNDPYCVARPAFSDLPSSATSKLTADQIAALKTLYNQGNQKISSDPSGQFCYCDPSTHMRNTNCNYQGNSVSGDTWAQAIQIVQQANKPQTVTT